QSWAAAAKEASRVLEQDSFNVKALYRRAQAYIGTADFAEAEADVKKGLSAEPGNADLAALLKKLK
ncbi:peptidylprolyl isomerase, partial [Haematococcus lacustris]